MKKILLITALTLLPIIKSFACGGDYDDYDFCYSRVFSQELINDPRYYPFLYASSTAYYERESVNAKNANIEEWQKYLNISYEEAYHLVFKATKEDIQRLLSGKRAQDDKLAFANAAFGRKYKDALQYLFKAKELEPYMRISGSSSGWGYYEDAETDIDKLAYDLVSLELQKGWKAAKDNEIKLRYGYQLVRFAHYNRKYREAVDLFDLYVKPLRYKPEMYYYALSQQAGAIRGMGDVITANSLFFEVFVNSSDLKVNALSSIRLNEGQDFQRFRNGAVTIDEKNDADLLLGYLTFSNPLASAQKIVERSPDAIQAKVLTARAICQIETAFVNSGDVSDYAKRHFPLFNKRELTNYATLLWFVRKQANSSAVKQKNYWNIATAYVCYLNYDYKEAQDYLDRVDINEAGYKEQRDILAMIIDIGREEQITSEVEDRIFAEYNDVFLNHNAQTGRAKVSGFVMDLLSNRYYLQQDYAKSLMLQNSLTALEDNPNMVILNDIEKLYAKPNKSKFEQYLVKEFRVGLSDVKEEEKVTVPNYVKYMKGMVYLTLGNLEEANQHFLRSGYSATKISSDVFGYNQIECFTCEENMKTDYLSEFPYIKSSMTEAELANTLIQLQQDALGFDLKAAKASYLFGNFYYNTSVTGYYRDYLRFGYAGSYRQWFFNPKNQNYIIDKLLYLEDIPLHYDNPVDIANGYLERAYELASGDEFKARIVFALSKCEQEMHYQTLTLADRDGGWWANYKKGWVMISNRRYFREMMKYKDTRFFAEVESNCKYFAYYVSRL